MQLSKTHPNEWLPVAKLSKEEVPDQVGNWLTAKAYVLSDAMRQVYDDFELRVLSEQVAPLTSYEKIYCKGDLGYVRQVFLLGDGCPQVFARVAVPLKVYTQYKTLFRDLGNRPIGETLLYNNPAIERSEFFAGCFAVAELPFITYQAEGQFQHRQQAILTMQLWSRQSVFSLAGKPFAVITETFLPGIKPLEA